MRKSAALCLFACLMAVALPALTRIGVDHDYLKLLPKGNRHAANYDAYLDAFVNDVGGAVIVESPRLCTPEGWNGLVAITDDLAAVPHVDRVIGITTEKYVVGRGEAVSVRMFSEVAFVNARERCNAALRYLPYKGTLINKDASATSIYAISETGVDAIALSRAIDRVIEKHKDSVTKGFCGLGDHYVNCRGDIYQIGNLHINAALSAGTARSSRLLAVVMFVMLFVVWLQTQSLRAGVITAFTGLFCVVFVFALIGYAGILQNPVNVLVVNMLIPLGAAFAIHAHGYIRRGSELWYGWLPKQAIRPFLFATITTVVGFGATGVSNIPALQQFGVMGVFGIVMCFVTTFLFAFPLLARKAILAAENKPNKYKGRRRHYPLLGEKTLVVVLVVLFGVSVVGFTRLRVNYGPVDYLLENNPAHVNFEKGRKVFGSYLLPLVVFDNETEKATDPVFQNTLQEFVEKTERETDGLYSSSLYKNLKVVNQAFTGDQSAGYPKTRSLASQFLLFFTEQDLDKYLDYDRKNAAVLWQVSFKNSNEFNKLDRRITAFAKENGWDATVTGRAAQFFRAGELIARNNMRSLCIGTALVLVTFMILLGSVRLAVLAIIPNVLPVVGGLAFMGLFNIDLDIGTSIVSAIALGLVVDDTGHIITRYKELRAHLPTKQAACQAADELRMPVIATTVTIVVGFFVFNLATLVPFHTFSRLLSATMVYALFGDLVILPALLAYCDQPWLPERAREVVEAAFQIIKGVFHFPRDVF